MSGRVPCVVPFCKRSRKRTHPREEFICANHWPLTSKTWRRRMFQFRRRKLWDLADRMWEMLKRQAIERAGGIG